MDALRQELRRRRLAREERAALRLLGRQAAGTSRDAPGELGRMAGEIASTQADVEAISAEIRACTEADRVDLARVAPWMRPVVVVRGACARGVLQHRRRCAMLALEQGWEALGRETVRRGGGTAADRGVAEPSGGGALPPWAGGMAREAMGFGRAVIRQLHAHLLPKAPAVAGMVVGWWIANTYTDSHVRSVLHSVGIGSGGTRVVSGSTYRAMSFWLPLLAAAVCAYLGERLARFWWREGSSPRPVEGPTGEVAGD